LSDGEGGGEDEKRSPQAGIEMAATWCIMEVYLIETVGKFPVVLFPLLTLKWNLNSPDMIHRPSPPLESLFRRLIGTFVGKDEGL
jgi:hypothetical protein